MQIKSLFISPHDRLDIGQNLNMDKNWKKWKPKPRICITID